MDLAATELFESGSRNGTARALPFTCESILSGVMVKTFHSKQEIFFEGDDKQSVYQIEAGAVCLYKTMADGRRQIFDFAFPGDVIGLGAGDEYSCSAQAIGATRVKCLPVVTLYQIAARDANFAMQLYRTVSSELEATRDLLLTLGQLGSLERVAIFLLALSQRNARAGKDQLTLSLPMTRWDIADLLGMTIETVSRSLTKLRQFKAIEMPRSSLIQIVDLEGLKQLAGRASCH